MVVADGMRMANGRNITGETVLPVRKVHSEDGFRGQIRHRVLPASLIHIKVPIPLLKTRMKTTHTFQI